MDAQQASKGPWKRSEGRELLVQRKEGRTNDIGIVVSEASTFFCRFLETIFAMTTLLCARQFDSPPACKHPTQPSPHQRSSYPKTSSAFRHASTTFLPAVSLLAKSFTWYGSDRLGVCESLRRLTLRSTPTTYPHWYLDALPGTPPSPREAPSAAPSAAYSCPRLPCGGRSTADRCASHTSGRSNSPAAHNTGRRGARAVRGGGNVRFAVRKSQEGCIAHLAAGWGMLLEAGQVGDLGWFEEPPAVWHILFVF